MSIWGRVFAALYDRTLAASEEAGLAERRRALLAAAHGRVVELGAGTGLNLAHYPPGGIEELVLVEPEEAMARRLRRRLASSPLPARVISARGESLPLPDGHFDVAVATLVLCTVGDPTRTLSELRRVLRPGGRLLFLEHVRAEEPKLARWQDRIDPVWSRVAHGCHCNRATLGALERSGFAVREVERDRIPKAAAFVRPMIAGAAERD